MLTGAETAAAASAPISEHVRFGPRGSMRSSYRQQRRRTVVGWPAVWDVCAAPSEGGGWASEAAVELSLPAETASARQVRRILVARLESWPSDVIDAAVLRASELVTNAVLHARGACVLRLELGTTAVRLSVTDTGPGVPMFAALHNREAGGRGLHLVDAANTSWGVTLASASKTAWCTFALSLDVDTEESLTRA